MPNYKVAIQKNEFNFNIFGMNLNRRAIVQKAKVIALQTISTKLKYKFTARLFK